MSDDTLGKDTHWILVIALILAALLPALYSYAQQERALRSAKCTNTLQKSYDPRRMVPIRSCP